MLTNSFSYLPVKCDGKWWLVSDLQIAQFLQQAGSKTKRKELLKTPLKNTEIALYQVEPIKGDLPIGAALEKLDGKPLPLPLIVCKDDTADEPEGFLTAFDLL